MVAREVIRIIALVMIIIACAATIIALMVLGALAVDAVAGWMHIALADERVIGGIAAAGICLAIIAGQALRESK